MGSERRSRVAGDAGDGYGRGLGDAGRLRRVEVVEVEVYGLGEEEGGVEY
jgi:hypothetical protein